LAVFQRNADRLAEQASCLLLQRRLRHRKLSVHGRSFPFGRIDVAYDSICGLRPISLGIYPVIVNIAKICIEIQREWGYTERK
jgi:hypothetical protein